MLSVGERHKLSQSRKKAILAAVERKRRQRTVATVVVAVILIAVIVVGIYASTLPKAEQVQLIPANIGLLPNCNRPLHTHDASGTIHVETDENRDYVLGDFFFVWGKIFNNSGVFPYTQPLPPYLDRCVTGTLVYHSHPVLTIIFKKDAPSAITMTVNGNPEARMQNFPLPRDSTANPENIVITYGPGVPASFG